MKKIVLISCASKKKPCKMRAEELYDSPLFRHSLRYAKTLKPDAIYILSAKHGLLDPDTVIEPYDMTLNSMSAPEVKEWARKVLEQLGRQTDLARDHFVILAGDKYRKHLLPHLASYEIPMLGMGIGNQLHFLVSH